MLRKRLLSVLLCLCMVMLMLPTMTIEAKAVGSYGVNFYNSCYTSQNPFYISNKNLWGQCTWYCWGRALEKCGVQLPCRGNADTWYSSAQNSGISVGTTPRANSILVTKGNGSENKNTGHVRFIESLHGTTASYSEANYISSTLPAKYNEGTWDTNSGYFYRGNSRWEERVIGYIYLDNSNPSQPTPPVENKNLGNDFYATIYYPNGGKLVRATGGDGSTYTNVEINGGFFASADSTDPKDIWHFTRYSDGSYKIVNEWCGWCLDLSGGIAGPEKNIGTWHEDHGGNPERWYITDAPGSDGRWYNLVSAVEYPQYTMDVYGGYTSNGTNVQIYYRQDGNTAQQFNIVKKSGYYKPSRPSAPTFRSISAAPAQTTISWNSVPIVGLYDSREYALNIYNKTTGQYVVSGRRTTSTSYTAYLPAGDYRAEISAVNTKYQNYASGYTTRDFTVEAEVFYNVSTSASSGGTASGDGTYLAGNKAAVTATPQNGYHFVKWTENGVTVSTNARYQFVVRKDRLLTAVFEQDVPLEPEATDAPVRIMPTNIQADGVRNYEGYGSLVINGDYYISDSYDEYIVNTPARIALIDRDGTFTFPYRDDPVGDGGNDTARFWYNDGVVSITLGSHYIYGGELPQYYHLDGTSLFPLEETEEEYTDEDGFEHQDWTTWPGGCPLRDGYAVLQYKKTSMISAGWAGSVEYEDKTLIIDKNGTVTCELPVVYLGGGGLDLEHVSMNMEVGWCGEGLFSFFDNRGTTELSGYMDPTGKTVIDLTGQGYISLWPFSEGLAAVKNQDEKIGFIDKTGVLVIPCVFDVSDAFCDGLCPVQKDGKWGYIDKSGNVVIPLEYDNAYGADSGLASVMKDEKCGLVDYDNNVVVPLEYDDISSYEGGVAYGIKNGRVYLITEYDPDNPDAPGSVETLSNGVKFVPFSCALSNSAAGYEIQSGRLPNGVELDSATGRISGIPLERGVFQFTVGSLDGSGDSFSYQLLVQDNTDSAVQQQPNDYSITQYVGTPSSNSNSFLVTKYQDETLVIDGPYDEFQRLFIDGVEMTRDEDYTAQSGSTILTIYGESFESLGEGIHTIAAEFLDSVNAVKQASQNYTLTISHDDQNPGDTPSDNPGNIPSVPDIAPSEPDYEPTYRIDVPARIAGGTVKVNTTRASRGTTVSITATPDSGYKLERLTVTDSGGNELHLTDKGNDKYTFTMPGSEVSVAAEFQSIDVPAPIPEATETPWQNPFTDVTEGSWYYDAVRFVNQNSLMNGIGRDTFAPDSNLSRAMLAQILYNKEGKPSVAESSAFTDVAPGEWYSNAVTWAAASNIVGGYGNGLFGSNDNITREQLAVMLWRYAGEPAATNKELHFNDADEVSGYALDALLWAVENNIINGKGGGILDPQGQATRAQVAQMLMNYLRK